MQWWKSSKWQFFVLFWYQISCSVFSINKQYRYYCGLYIGVVHAVQIMILYSQNYFVYTTYHIIRDCTHCIFLRLTECESGAVYVIIWNIQVCLYFSILRCSKYEVLCSLPTLPDATYPFTTQISAYMSYFAQSRLLQKKFRFFVVCAYQIRDKALL